jgi:hypothetical protein
MGRRSWCPTERRRCSKRGAFGNGRWHAGVVGLLFRLAELLILIVPVVGVILAGIKVLSAASQQRREEPRDPDRIREEIAAPESARRISNRSARWRSITRMLEEHRRTEARWLDYELDFAKLLDFPLMTDMSNPLMTAFHKAKLRADLLRPARAEDLLEDPDAAQQYLAAVEDCVTAFNAAETEAVRRRRSDFSREGQQRLARAQNLLRVASDSAATPQEREHAYDVACKELDGLIVLPAATRGSIERGIAGEIDGP